VAAEDWRKQVPRARESMGSRSGFNALEGREFEGFTHPKIGVGKGFVPDLSQICHREIGAPGGIRTPDQWLRKVNLRLFLDIVQWYPFAISSAYLNSCV
jgi:hypothetical protein